MTSTSKTLHGRDSESGFVKHESCSSRTTEEVNAEIRFLTSGLVTEWTQLPAKKRNKYYFEVLRRAEDTRKVT